MREKGEAHEATLERRRSPRLVSLGQSEKGRLFDLFFYDGGVDGVEIDFNLFAFFVASIDLITASGLFELPNLVALFLDGFFEGCLAHPFFFWLVGAVLPGMGGPGEGD